MVGLLLAQAIPVLAASVTATVTTGSWSGAGPGTTSVVHNGTGGLAEFQYSLDPAGLSETRTWTFKATATSGGAVPLTWRLTGFHGFFDVRVGLETFTTPSGGSATYTSILTGGPQNCCTEPSGGFDYDGATTVTVQAGDEFGFRISGSNYDTTNVLQGTLKVGLNTVVNGGFEQLPVANTASYDTVPAGSTQLSPWAVASGSVDHIGGYWIADEGAQSLDLDGIAPGAIQQSVPTVAGHTYRVAFSYSANPDRTSGTPEMAVKADGTTIGTFTHAYDAILPNITWDRGAASFTAQNSTTLLEFASTNSTGGFGIAVDDVTVVPDLGVEPVVPGFTFGAPSVGGNDGDPLVLAQGISDEITIPVNLTGGATGVAVAITGVVPDESGVTATTDGVATETSTVTVVASADATPGNYVLTVNGAVGPATDSVTLFVTVAPAPATVGVPLLTNAYSAPGSPTTMVAGRISADPSTQYTISFASAASCPGGAFPGDTADFGSIAVTTDEDGNAFFNSSTPPGSVSGAPAAGQSFIAAHVTGPAGRNSGYSPCVVNSPDNDTWPRALQISGNGAAVASGTWIDQPGTARWFKVPVAPGGSVALDLSGVPADYDVYLFRDIKQTYDALTTEQNLTKLSAEFAGSGFSGSGFSGSGFSGSGFSGSGFSGSGFSGSGFSGSGFSPDSYSGSGFSGSGFSGSGFSGSGFSGSGFSGSGFSGSGFSGSGFSGSGFSADSFSAAQLYSLIAWSNNLGLADEHAASNTWTSTGDFYIRVNGKNGVASLTSPFTLKVTVDGNLCSAVGQKGTKPGPVANTKDTVILTDTSRFGTADTTAMLARLGQLATATNGVVVDFAGPGRVHDLQAQADANPGCVYAKNLVAQAAKDVVDAYRSGNTSGGVKYVVLAGGDNVLPFFRYPDTSSIGPEVNYFPPVQGTSTSEASLRSNYVLGQDAYGSTISIPLGPVDFPIPDLPVGRLVENPGEITGMAQAYLDQAVVSPSTSLVTGYDFIEDAAKAVKTNLDAGTGQAGRSLIDPYGASPATGWTATALKSELLGRRNDITFLGGHFSANSALAADFATVMTTDDFVAATPDFKNTIIFSIGCHSGYNIVDADGIANVTRTLDWSQAFARRQVTSILGTGYQYGDTDFIEYSERIYSEFSKQLRYGSGPVGIGNALLAAKLAYLKQTPAIGDLHDKSLLESALYGLPMLGVNMPSGRMPAPTGADSLALTTFTSDPGLTTGLRYADVDQTTSSTQKSKTLNVQGGGTLSAKYYTGPGDGVLTTPGAPVLPLYAKGAKAGDAGYILRGIGFTGGRYADSTVTPLTGAPGTELQSAHTSFSSPTFYPAQMWSANYFDALGGSGGVTLFTTPAQHRAPAPGSDTVTLRLYDNLKLRLFYSDSIAAGAKSAPPVIYGVTSDLQAGSTLITARVVGDPKADVQQVWVTFTEPGSGLWDSFDLVRSQTDPSLWTGSRTLAAGTQFIVQAVNGFGVVSRNDNFAGYYQAGVAASTPASGVIALSGPDSGVYGATTSATATLTSGGTAVSGKLVVLTLGSVTRSGTTDGNGKVTVSLPLSAGAGTYPLTATFQGDASTSPASASEPFTITAAGSTVTITCPATVIYTGAAQTPCTARATAPDGLNELLPVSYSANTGPGTATASAQFYGDAAHAASTGTRTFGIIWPFTGFFSPVDNLPTLNAANAGQAIPVKFSLGGNRGLSILNGTPKVVSIACNATAQVDDIEAYLPATSQAGIQYDAASTQYTYVWKTAKALAGSCRQLQVVLMDGTVHSANFRFK